MWYNDKLFIHLVQLAQTAMTSTITPSHQFRRVFHPKFLHAPKSVSICHDDRPLYLEIGAGKGKHAVLFATANPDKRLIAVERTSEKFSAFDKLSHANSLDNLTNIHADAIAFTVHFIQPNSLDGAFILYPNPEPHNKNQRWLNMPFFEFLLSRMKAGATITLASNITEYIDEAVELLDTVWCLPYVKQAIAKSSARTHFEIKYLARDELCQEIIITKPDGYLTRFDDVPAMSL